MKPYAPSKKQLAAANKLKIDTRGLTGGQIGESIRGFFHKPKTTFKVDNTANVSTEFKFKNPEVQQAYDRFRNNTNESIDNHLENEFNQIRKRYGE